MGASGDMRAFVQVVESQSFSGAATVLGLSPLGHLEACHAT